MEAQGGSRCHYSYCTVGYYLPTEVSGGYPACGGAGAQAHACPSTQGSTWVRQPERGRAAAAL